MEYKIIEVEGVGNVYADKLVAAEITSVEELLAATATPTQRKKLADATGISPSLIMKWANHADLMRINGIGPQTAELLEVAGVDTVKELQHRNAENLHTKMVEANDRRNLTGRVPSAAELQRMIDEAKTLEPVLKY